MGIIPGMTTQYKSIILFDGVCNLCNGFVKFVIPRDRNNRFLFGALQENYSKNLLATFNLPSDKITTIVLIEKGKVYTQSDAVLRIAKQLDGVWKWSYAFIILPKPARDWVYKLVAKSRYKIFGKRESCMIPTPELNQRFLHADL